MAKREGDLLDRRDFLASSAATIASSLCKMDAPNSAIAQTSSAQPATHDSLRFRQVNLDFHTSELITDVGADFQAAEFLATLQSARVNSINLFAKCHHGWAYYDTKVAHKHPHLKIDLLSEQIDALRPDGISVTYYYSLVWDVRTAKANPEWRARDKNGNGILSGYWPWMCMNTPYLDQVIAENQEILARFQVDGALWDILIQPKDGCFCRWCVEERKLLGLTDSPQDIYHQNKLVALKTEKALFNLLKSKQPHAEAFFNSRLVVGIRDELDYYTHLEIESLPTGGWGYSHFEHRVRYCSTLGKQMVGITGRFHKSWGDFGGFKPQAALDFECMNFLANGARACVGDQLHPRGKLDPLTYKLIGRAFGKVEKQESWVRGTRGVADIGVISTLATNPDMSAQGLPPADEGFTNMLVELHQQFDVLDLNADLTRYKLIILPDNVLPLPQLVEKLRVYVRNGGAMIVTHKSLLNADGTAFVLAELGVRPLGPTRYRDEYLVPRLQYFPSVPVDAYFLYRQGLAVESDPGVDVLAVYGHPYFDRSPQHWCSHAQTPVSQISDEPVVVRAHNLIYCANPLFSSYALDGELLTKLLVKDLIEMCLTNPAVRTSRVPSTARLTLQQGDDGRQVVQILYAPYERRAPLIDIIEEPATFARGRVQVRRTQAPKQVVALDGEGRELKMHSSFSNCYVELNLPPVTGQLAILIR